MTHFALPIGRPVAEAQIRTEIRDIVQALAPEAGIPVQIAVTVRRRAGDRPINEFEIDVNVVWE
jgi:hypothetical protein